MRDTRSHHRKEAGSDVEGRADSSPDRSDRLGNPDSRLLAASQGVQILALQRFAGNRATTALFQQESTANKDVERRETGPEGTATRSQAAKYGRQAGDRPPVQLAPTPKNEPYLTPPAIERVEVLEAERREIEAQTRFDMGLAFTAFCSACHYNASAIKAAAKAEAEFASMLIDIFAGFAAPAFVTAVGPMLLGRLASKVAGFAKVRDRSQPVYNFVTGGVEEYVRIQYLTQSDVLKGIFAGATKAATSGMKIKSEALFGDTETDEYLRVLQDGFQRDLSELSKSLPKLSTEEILAVSVGFDAEHANVHSYIAIIKRKTDKFKKEVRAIGLPTSGMGKTTLIRVAIDGDDNEGRGGLAVADRVKEQFTGQIGRIWFDWEFKHWVGSEMREMALSRYKRLFGDTANIPVVNQLKIRNMPTD